MWRQHSAKRDGNTTTGLAPLDPNFNNNNFNNVTPQSTSAANSFINMSKQSIDVEKSNIFQQQPQFATTNNKNNNTSNQSMMMMSTNNAIPSLDLHNPANMAMYQNYYTQQQQQQSSVNNNMNSSVSSFVTTAPAPAAVNHRDRFQMYLERYAPNHPETAMRRAQLLHKNSEQSAIDPIVHRHPAVELVAQSLNQQNDHFFDKNVNSSQIQNQASQYASSSSFYDPLSNGDGTMDGINNNTNNLALLKVVAEHSSAKIKKENNTKNKSGNNNIVEDIESNSASVLDVRPDRLRFELCAARSENDQLKKRITTLQNMNNHLRDNLEEAMLSEREQVVRANSIESQDRSLLERLTDAESENRELRRRLSESESTLAQTETRLAQARGRLAAFDHIANDFSTTSNSSSSSFSKNHLGAFDNGISNRKATRSDSTTELMQTLSTSHYMLSVLSVLRFWFNLQHQRVAEARPDMGIVVHVGGGVPPINITSLVQATEALQTLICGNRESDSEMRTRVVGWTPDDILRELRSVTMTCETMIVRLLTDGAVGTMLRKNQQIDNNSDHNNEVGSNLVQNNYNNQNKNNQQQHVIPVSTNSLQYYAPVASRKQAAPLPQQQKQQQQQQQQQQVQNLMGVSDSKHDDEAWLQEEQRSQQRLTAEYNRRQAEILRKQDDDEDEQELQIHNKKVEQDVYHQHHQDETESPVRITSAPRRNVDVGLNNNHKNNNISTTLHSPPRQQQQQSNVNTSTRNIQPTYQVGPSSGEQQENIKPTERSTSQVSNNNKNVNALKNSTAASSTNKTTANAAASRNKNVTATANNVSNDTSASYQKELREKQQAEREKAEMARLRTFGSLMGTDDENQGNNLNSNNNGLGEPCQQQ